MHLETLSTKLMFSYAKFYNSFTLENEHMLSIIFFGKKYRKTKLLTFLSVQKKRLQCENIWILKADSQV